MKTALTLISLVALLHLGAAIDSELWVYNNCPHSIYVANERANIGNFELPSRASKKWKLPATTNDALPKPRIWALKGCDGSGRNCESQEAIGLAELMWQDYGDKNFRDFNWYDISMVDGYNLPITMEPYKKDNNGGNCYKVSCKFNLANCPGPNQQKKNGKVVGCKNLNRDAVTDYSKKIKSACPTTYSWSKDDTAGQRACRAGNRGMKITFC